MSCSPSSHPSCTLLSSLQLTPSHTRQSKQLFYCELYDFIRESMIQYNQGVRHTRDYLVQQNLLPFFKKNSALFYFLLKLGVYIVCCCLLSQNKVDFTKCCLLTLYFFFYLKIHSDGHMM